MDTQDTSPAVMLFFDKQRFIFNAGEVSSLHLLIPLYLEPVWIDVFELIYRHKQSGECLGELMKTIYNYDMSVSLSAYFHTFR
jgi:hypothetical protein